MNERANAEQLNDAAAQQAAIVENTKRLVNKYSVVSDREHPLIVAYAAGELLGLALMQLKTAAPEAYAETLKWFKDGVARLEAQ